MSETELERLRAELASALAANRGLVRLNEAVHARELAARERIAALEEGLRFYANAEIYKPHPHGPAFDRGDQSYVARALLDAAPQEPKT